MKQVPPCATQVALPPFIGTQHPLFWHDRPGQQTWPPAPHCAQMPITHAVPIAEHIPPPQQACPAPPHCTQVPFWQAFPAAQMPPQQGCPAMPQPEHTPFAHIPPFIPHAIPFAAHAPA
jgi:hypothetical protein